MTRPALKRPSFYASDIPGIAAAFKAVGEPFDPGHELVRAVECRCRQCTIVGIADTYRHPDIEDVT